LPSSAGLGCHRFGHSSKRWLLSAEPLVAGDSRLVKNHGSSLENLRSLSGFKNALTTGLALRLKSLPRMGMDKKLPCHPCNPWSKNLCPKTLCDVLEHDLRSPPNHGAARRGDATFDAVFLARARVNREQINFILAGATEIRQRGPARSTS